MTDPTGHGPEQGHGVRSEEDRISTGAIVAVGVASLLIFTAASIVTSVYLHVERTSTETAPIPPEIGQNKIGMVEQQLFDLVTRGERQRSAQLERLGSYGWVDKQAGVVHLPIERAMDLVVQGIRPMPTTTGPKPSETPGGQP
jgi:hypothetical protein